MSTLVRKPSVFIYPGAPAVPPTPPRTIKKTTYYDGFAYLAFPVGYTVVSGDVIERTADYIYGVDLTLSYTTTVAATKGTPATPSRTVTLGLSGWGAGGRFIEGVKRHQEVCFASDVRVSSLFGLALPGKRYSFTTPRYAFLIRRGTRGWDYGYYYVFAYIDGMEVGEVASNLSPEYMPNMRYFITVLDDTVVFRVLGFGSYTFPVTNPPSNLEIYATPYSVADSVRVVSVIDSPARITTTLPAVTGRISRGSGAKFRGLLPPMQASLGVERFRSVTTPLPGMRTRIAEKGSRVISTIPPVEGNLSTELVIGMTSVFGMLPQPAYTATMRQGIRGDVNAFMPGVGSRFRTGGGARVRTDVGFSVVTKINSRASGLNLEVAGLSSFASISSAMALLTMDSLSVASSAELSIILELSSIDAVRLEDDATLGSIVELLSMERIAVNSSISSDLQREALQYAVNIATGAISTYEGFDFSGFVNVGDECFAWRADGLYKIGSGNTHIRAAIDFGITDFGDAGVKRADAAWIGVRTDGDVFLKVSTDSDVNMVYRVIDSENYGKASLAKGASGRFWGLKLELEDASFAAVDSIEVSVGLSQRRLNRR